MNRTYPLFLSIYALFPSVALGTVEDECHTIPLHIRETRNNEAFITQLEEACDGVYLTDVPIPNEDGTYILAKFFEEKTIGSKTLYEDRPCMLSSDRSHCIYYQKTEIADPDGEEEPQIEVTKLRFTLNNGKIVRVQRIEEDESFTEIEKSPFLNMIAPILIPPSLSQIMGTPSKIEFFVRNGEYNVRVKTFIQDLHESTSAILGEVGQVNTLVNQVITKQDQLLDTLNATLTERINSLLSELSAASLKKTTSVLEDNRASIISAMDHQRKLSDENTKEHVRVLQRGFSEVVTTRADQIDNALRDSTEALQQVVTTSADKIDSTLRNSTNALQQSLNTRADKIYSTLNSTTEALQQVVTTRADKIDSTLNSTTEALQQLLNTRADKIDSTLNSTSEALQQSLKTHADKIDSTLNSTSEALQQLLNTRADKIDSTLNSTSETLQQLVTTSADKIDSTLRSTTEVLQQDFRKIVTTRADIIDRTLDDSTARIYNAIQSVIGVKLRHDGKPEYGSALEQITSAIVRGYQHIGMSEDMLQAFNGVAHVLKIHGGLPILYRDSIESMLIGHTIHGKTPVVTPLTTYLSEIESFMKNNDYFCGYLRPWKRDVSAKILNIIDFFQKSSDTTLTRVLPEFIRLFGTKFPSYEAPSLNIARYCENVHFSEADFGLYGWVKDIHAILRNFSSYSGSELKRDATNARLAYERLLRGVVIHNTEEMQAIPRTHFYGLQTYTEILDECSRIIDSASKQSFEGRFEIRMGELLHRLSSFARTAEVALQKTTEMYENLVSCTHRIHGGDRETRELIAQLVREESRHQPSGSSHHRRPHV
ncbi:MAG: hypothetical protein LBJ89_04535 [Holosporales bacterium]|jgi:ABC-type transporter Mla subunit MlaD|nr:hypothetical protein [Holosporales bacterium]